MNFLEVYVQTELFSLDKSEEYCEGISVKLIFVIIRDILEKFKQLLT